MSCVAGPEEPYEGAVSLFTVPWSTAGQRNSSPVSAGAAPLPPVRGPAGGGGHAGTSCPSSPSLLAWWPEGVLSERPPPTTPSGPVPPGTSGGPGAMPPPRPHFCLWAPPRVLDQPHTCLSLSPRSVGATFQPALGPQPAHTRRRPGLPPLVGVLRSPHLP